MSERYIVPLDGTHLSGVADIERLCFSSPWSVGSLTLLTMGENGGFVALDGKTVVGYIGYLGVIDEYEITNVATHPDYQRQGIGTALLAALVEKAKQNGIVRITLDVRESNTPALALYEKFHFSPCGRRKSFYSAPREDAIVMEWKSR